MQLISKLVSFPESQSVVHTNTDGLGTRLLLALHRLFNSVCVFVQC